MDKAVRTAPISWPGPNGDLQAAWAAADNPRGGVLVIHENKGLNDTGPRYNPAAATDAWRRVLDWFGRYLA